MPVAKQQGVNKFLVKKKKNRGKREGIAKRRDVFTSDRQTGAVRFDTSAPPFVLIVYPVCLLTRVTTPSFVPPLLFAGLARVYRPFIGFPVRICLPAKFRRTTSEAGGCYHSRDSAVAKPFVRNFVDAIPHGRRYMCRICTSIFSLNNRPLREIVKRKGAFSFLRERRYRVVSI